MEKLLHERLRELGNEACPLNIAFSEYDTSGFSYDDEVKELFNRFADEIERYYIQRPRFEDGEPVPWGCKDIMWNDGEKYWVFNAIDDKGVPVAIGTSEVASRAEMTDDGFTKRPTTKIYDADGVEIKVGDTVYNLENDGEQGTVRCFYSYGVGIEWSGGWRSDGVNPRYLTHEKPVFDADGVRIKRGDTVWTTVRREKFTVTGFRIEDGTPLVVCEDMGGKSWELLASDLTHKEPDNQQRIDDDATLHPSTYCKRYKLDVEPFSDLEEEMTAMVRDLLKRQRALIER